MANITEALLNDNIATVVGAQALGYLKSNTVLAGLVRRDWANELATHGKTIDIPIAGGLSVNDKAADTVITLQTPADSKVSITLDKHKEVSFLIEDIGEALSRADWLSIYAGDAMMVMAEQIDADIAALYTGLSQTIDASTGSGGLLATDFTEASRLLNAAKAPLAERYAVLHEDAFAEAMNLEKITNRDYAESLGALAANSWGGSYGGFGIFMSQNIPVATTAKNLFFHRNALALASRPLPPAPQGAGVIQNVMSEDGIGMRVTLSYDHDHLGTKVTIDVLYGVAEIRDNHGVVVSTTEV